MGVNGFAQRLKQQIVGLGWGLLKMPQCAKQLMAIL